MAILHYKDDVPFGSFDVNVKEYAIGGKLLTVKMTIDGFEAENLPKDVIKRKMAMQIADALLERKLIEFTKQMEHSTGRVLIHSRCYVAPDEQVKILRIHESSLPHRR